MYRVFNKQKESKQVDEVEYQLLIKSGEWFDCPLCRAPFREPKPKKKKNKVFKSTSETAAAIEGEAPHESISVCE